MMASITNQSRANANLYYTSESQKATIVVGTRPICEAKTKSSLEESQKKSDESSVETQIKVEVVNDELITYEDLAKLLPKPLLMSLGICSVRLKGWILLLRYSFDSVLQDGPVSDIQLLIQPKTMRFIHRVKGKTKTYGTLGEAQHVEEVCTDVFNEAGTKLEVLDDDPISFETLSNLLPKHFLKALGIYAIRLNGWILLLRTSFDCVLQDEPFSAIQLLIQPRFRRFIHRVWDRTKLYGSYVNAKHLAQVCIDVFNCTVPCLGRTGDNVYETEDSRDKSLFLSSPVDRYISSSCLLAYKYDKNAATHDETLGKGLCQPCKAMTIKTPSDNVFLQDLEGMDDSEVMGSQIEEPAPKKKPRKTADSEVLADNSTFEEPLPRRKGYSLRGRRQVKRKVEGITDTKHFKRPDVEPPRKIVEGDTVSWGCPTCERTFKIKKSLKIHRINKHFYGDFLCRLCNEFACDYATTLFKHHFEKHPDYEFSIKCCKKISFNKLEDIEDMKSHLLECESAKTKFPSQPARKRACETCGKVYNNSLMMREHQNMHNGVPPLKCNECPMTTYHSASLEKHKETHLREKGETSDAAGKPIIFKCEYCDRTFASSSYRQTHINAEHLGIKKEYKCKHCGKQMMTGSTLRRHINLMHNKENPNVCDECGMDFGDSVTLKRHKKSHEGPTHFCNICGKGLTSQASLDAHIYQHTGENPVECDECDYTCKSTAVLSKHKNSAHGRTPKVYFARS